MGSSKESGSSTTINQTSSTPSAEEVARNRLLLEREQALDPQVRQVQSQGLNLANLLLTGQALPGYLGGLPGGISEDVTQGIVNKSLADIAPQFQAGGLLDSGVRASIGARTAGDIRTQSAQFNVQNLLQLLNQALGGQAQVQAPMIGYANNLTQGLAGLRSMNSTSTTNSTTTKSNPFLSNPRFGIGPFSFGG